LVGGADAGPAFFKSGITVADAVIRHTFFIYFTASMLLDNAF